MSVEVYTKRCYEALMKEKEEKKQERLKKWAEAETRAEQDEMPALTDNDTTSDIPESSNTSTDEHLFLKLRGSDNKDILLRVKKVYYYVYSSQRLLNV
jgi:hypothetical protein